jgi:hypothetical protein
LLINEQIRLLSNSNKIHRYTLLFTTGRVLCLLVGINLAILHYIYSWVCFDKYYFLFLSFFFLGWNSIILIKVSWLLLFCFRIVSILSDFPWRRSGDLVKHFQVCAHFYLMLPSNAMFTFDFFLLTEKCCSLSRTFSSPRFYNYNYHFWFILPCFSIVFKLIGFKRLWRQWWSCWKTSRMCCL